MTKDKKKTRAELLGELESIKDLLADESPPTPSDPVPILDEVADLAAAADTAEEDPDNVPTLVNTADPEPPLLDADDAVEDIPILTDFDPLQEQRDPKAPKTSTNTKDSKTLKKATKAAKPGQQSLFEPAAKKETTVTSKEQPGPRGNAQPSSSSASSKPKTPAKSVAELRANLDEPLGENPFLPQHIRERLHKIAEPEPKLATPEPAAKTPAPEKPVLYKQALDNPAHDKPTSDKKEAQGTTSIEEELMDSVIQEFLPKIEAELRRRLRQWLQRESSDHQD